MWLKALLLFLKPFLTPLVESEVAALVSQKAMILALLATQEGNVATLVVNAILAVIQSKSGLLGSVLLSFLTPLLQSEAASLVAEGTTEASDLFDKLVAFIIKEEAYL